MPAGDAAAFMLTWVIALRTFVRQPALMGRAAGSATLLELWGGLECTVNRIGDRYRDQTCLTGHQHRLDDLERFASLGIKSLRYPVLWERIAPDRADDRDWRWTDERLREIARLGMRPIAGLVHHGSGPRYTSLLDDGFAPGLAAHARAVAERYPDVTDWTPVNEPLTTARFSALYGHWFPHDRNDRAFWSALLNQIDATRLAMRAIRAVNPAARLIQTEDLGRTYAIEPLARQAEYNNVRRWATWDLLTGRLGPDHPLWMDLERFGFADRVRAIADDPCPPDVIGVNHYVTSDRFLDHRLDRYDLPRPASGYHDLTAARVLDPPPAGLTGVLREAWDRYRLPLAVTESHLGCTREEQLRWVAQSWRDCEALAADGVDLRALTAWALLGNVDWSSLLTQERGHHEPGVFDLRGPAPRPTALATLLRELADGRAPSHPVLAGRGWWQRDVRLEHSAFAWGAPVKATVPIRERARPLLIMGAGVLGHALAGACRVRGLEHRLIDHATLSIGNEAGIAALLDAEQPWAVLNAAGSAGTERAEIDPAACARVHADGAITLARLCAEREVHCTLFSCDAVFDGRRPGAYVERDALAPVSALGRAKAAMEAGVLDLPGTLVVRTAAFFSPYDPHNPAMAAERSLRAGRLFRVADVTFTPTFLPDLVSACLDLAIDGETGVWHLTSGEAVGAVDLARRIAMALGLDPTLIIASAPADHDRTALLASDRGALLPRLEDAIGRHVAARRQDAHAMPMESQAA